MSTRNVTTQAELDAALTEAREHPRDYSEIVIRSERGVWLQLSEASGSATVEAYGSATVRAYGSATVEAYGSATVEAYGSATVRAYGSATVEAGSHTAVHLHSGRATITGGVLIDHTQIDEADTATWCAYHGAQVIDGHAVVYKAVRADLKSQRGTTYTPGTTASCDDFTDVDECGGGLHFSPTAAQAHQYDWDATRYVELRVPLDAIRTITGGGTAKAKAASVECVREVDIMGRPVETAVAA